jgi:hypothetical protein
MIILDEQLLEHDIEENISKWYRGTVRFITELRPNTIIKDDAIPQLLRQQNQATFITINERDFWRKVTITEQFCVVCLTLPDSRTYEIPNILRELFQYSEFKTKANRMGKVIRIADNETSYYTWSDKTICLI